MDDGYLPDYYIRKKQRDRTYRVVWNVVLVAALLVGGGFLGNFLYNSFGVSWKKKGIPTVNEEHANELNALETEDRINDAIATQQSAVGDLMADAGEADAEAQAPAESNGSIPADSAVDPDSVDITDVDYSESFPLVTVSLDAGGAPASGNMPEATPAAQQEESREPSTESTPVNTSGQAGAEKPAQDKPKQQEQPKDEPEMPVISTKTYHVYAAEVTTKAEAEMVVKQLAEHGYKGSIIEQNPYFLIKVMQTKQRSEASALVDRLKSLGFNPIPTVSNE